MPIMINPRRRRKRRKARRVAKRRKSRGRIRRRRTRRNPADISAFGAASRRRAKRRQVRHVAKRRKKTKKTRGFEMPRKRGRKSRRKTLPLYAQFRRRRKFHAKKNPKRRRRHFIRVGRRGRIPVRRTKYKAIIRANPYRNILNNSLFFGLGLLGNTIVSNLLGKVLGGVAPFLKGGFVPSAAVSVLAYLLLGKQQPMIVSGSVVATAFEGLKFVLPQGIKDMIGLGQLTYEEPLALPYDGTEEYMQGIPAYNIEGFAPADEISGFAPDVATMQGDVQVGASTPDTSLDEAEFGIGDALVESVYGDNA